MANLANLFTKRLNEALAPYGAVSEFCRTSGFSRNAVEKWLSGETSPTLRNLEVVADVLGFSPSELIQVGEAEGEPLTHVTGTFVSNLNKFLRIFRWELSELAEAAKIPAPRLERILAGNTPADLAELGRIAEAFHVDPYLLLVWAPESQSAARKGALKESLEKVLDIMEKTEAPAPASPAQENPLISELIETCSALDDNQLRSLIRAARARAGLDEDAGSPAKDLKPSKKSIR